MFLQITEAEMSSLATLSRIGETLSVVFLIAVLVRDLSVITQNFVCKFLSLFFAAHN